MIQETVGLVLKGSTSRTRRLAETPGRPRLAVSCEQLEALQDCRFRWSDIGRMLCVSSSTLRCRRHKLGMPVEGRKFSQLTDTQLDDLIRQVLQLRA